MSFNQINEAVQLVRSGKSPEQIAISMLEANSRNNPFYNNLLYLAKNNDTKTIEAIVRNMAKERGIDYDVMIEEFKKSFGF